MTYTRSIEVDYETPSCALVRGYGSRDLVMKVTKRTPVWATLSRGWVVQPNTADDVIAIAEERGYLVTVVDQRPRPARVAPATPGDPADPGRGLW